MASVKTTKATCDRRRVMRALRSRRKSREVGAASAPEDFAWEDLWKRIPVAFMDRDFRDGGVIPTPLQGFHMLERLTNDWRNLRNEKRSLLDELAHEKQERAAAQQEAQDVRLRVADRERALASMEESFEARLQARFAHEADDGLLEIDCSCGSRCGVPWPLAGRQTKCKKCGSNWVCTDTTGQGVWERGSHADVIARLRNFLTNSERARLVADEKARKREAELFDQVQDYKIRCRKAAQTLIEEIGATGAEAVEYTAARAVEKLRLVQDDRDLYSRWLALLGVPLSPDRGREAVDHLLANKKQLEQLRSLELARRPVFLAAEEIAKADERGDVQGTVGVWHWVKVLRSRVEALRAKNVPVMQPDGVPYGGPEASADESGAKLPNVLWVHTQSDSRQYVLADEHSIAVESLTTRVTFVLSKMDAYRASLRQCARVLKKYHRDNKRLEARVKDELRRCDYYQRGCREIEDNRNEWTSRATRYRIATRKCATALRKCVRERDEARAKVARLYAEVERLRAWDVESDAMRRNAVTEARRIRPVVEAAIAWWDGDGAHVLGAAVDAYRAQPDGQSKPDNVANLEAERDRMKGVYDLALLHIADIAKATGKQWDDPEGLAAHVAAVVAERDRLREALRSVEWSQVGNRCPSCGRSHVGDVGFTGTHADGCALRAALEEKRC